MICLPVYISVPGAFAIASTDHVSSKIEASGIAYIDLRHGLLIIIKTYLTLLLGTVNIHTCTTSVIIITYLFL